MKEAILKYLLSIMLGVIIGLVSMFMISGGCSKNRTITIGKDGITSSTSDTTFQNILFPKDSASASIPAKVKRDTVYKELVKEDSARVKEAFAMLDSMQHILNQLSADRIDEIDTCINTIPKVCLNISHSSAMRRIAFKYILDSLSIFVPEVINQNISMDIRKWYEEPSVMFPGGAIVGIILTLVIENFTNKDK